MTRKFLFCFPLRAGNVVFGYIVIILSIAVVAWHLYQLCRMIFTAEEVQIENTKFHNWQNVGDIFGQTTSLIVALITTFYYLSYVILGLLLFIFGTIFTCGASKANHCMVNTFFVYSFIHLFFTIGLIVWEATSDGWIQLGLILASDMLLIVCMFGVKYLMEAIRTGKMYSRPGEIYYKS